MREIKFRAWDKEEEKMWMPEDEGNEIGFIANFAKGTIDLWDIEQQRDIDCEIMQYIGKKDKNGKEIYEGDILRNKQGDILIAVWQKCRFILQKKNKRPYSTLYLDSTEIVGNIFETPELLEEK